MENSGPPPVFATRISDPELLREAVRGPDLQPCILDKTRKTSELARVMLPDGCLDMVRLGPAMLFSGPRPRDCYTLLVVLACPTPGHAFNFGLKHTDGYMGFFAPGGTLDATAPAGYRNATLTLPASSFHASLATRGDEIPDVVLGRGAALHVGTAEQGRLRALVTTIREMVWDPEQPLHSAAVRRHVTRSIRTAFLDALLSGCSSDNTSQALGVRRQQRLRQARDYIAAHLSEPIYMDDLSLATSLTQRGLENLFHDFFGVSPVRYLRLQRLHGARRALQETPPVSGIVKKIALDWGFWHHGHFAADYRALFGENPSATVRGLSYREPEHVLPPT